MSWHRFRVPLAAVFVGLFAVSVFAFVAPPARAGTATVFSEDFESGVLDPQWSAGDNNGASGLDYWGVSGYRPRTGSFSAWSAYVGNQSDTGQDNTVVHLYDDDMQADLVVDLQVNGFTSLTLSFYYWARGESGGGDFLQAWYEAGGNLTSIFTNTGSANWDFASVAVPTSVERLIIRFQTDGANHNFEGAYIDDIVLTGIEDVPPSSSVGALSAFSNANPTFIPYTAQDNPNASGVAYVELWWRLGTFGAFAPYNTTANPSGQWTISPVPFDLAFASGEGRYEFYTVAVDNAQNTEAPPATADASITIDLTAPTISITAPGANAHVTTSSLTIRWTASDATSGIDRFEVWVDSGAHVTTTDVRRTVGGLTDGRHTVHVLAVDAAGNSREATATFTVSTGLFSWDGPYGPLPLLLILIAIAAALLWAFLAWGKRRRDEEEAPPPQESSEGSGEDVGAEPTPADEAQPPEEFEL